MIRRKWLALVLLAGCSYEVKSDPESDRLLPRRQAVVASGTNGGAVLMLVNARREFEVRTLPPGTRVQIESDEEKSSPRKGYKAGPDGKFHQYDDRPVRVMVLDGEHEGLIGRVFRPAIRPVAR